MTNAVPHSAMQFGSQATVLRREWGEWIAAQGPWHVFGALTYDQRRYRGRTDTRYGAIPPDVTKAHAKRWLRDTNKVLDGRLEAAVLALEYQKNGWPHFHPLLRLAGGLHGNEFALAGGLWYGDHGYAKLEAPRDAKDVTAYAAKYLSKGLDQGDVLIWPFKGPWPPHQRELQP